MFGYDKPKTKSTTRLGTGKMGEMAKREMENPNLCSYAGPANVFPLFPTLFAIYHLQQAAAVLATRPGEPQQHGPNTEITNEAKGKSSGWRGAGGEGRGRTNNTTCKTKGSSLPHSNNLSNRHHNCSPSIGQKLAELERDKDREGGGELLHIKVNEFTTSNCGAKLIEKVYLACEGFPFSPC